jgi:hypothetical protein
VPPCCVAARTATPRQGRLFGRPFDFGPPALPRASSSRMERRRRAAQQHGCGRVQARRRSRR